MFYKENTLFRINSSSLFCKQAVSIIMIPFNISKYFARGYLPTTFRNFCKDVTELK